MDGRAELVDVARHAFDWIGSQAVDVDGGQAWLDDETPSDDLYCGTAGVLLGCAEAGAAGLDTTQVATGARDRLLHIANDPSSSGMPDDALFTGWAGVTVALRAWSQVTNDATAAAAAEHVTSEIAERVLRRRSRRERYHDVISGDAGILLALAPGGSENAVRAVNVLSDDLVDAAETWPAGLHWRMVAGWESLMPGFSHGTAGVAYALAAAGRALDRDDLIATAVRGAEALLDAGDRPDGWAVPLTIPPPQQGPAVNFGWCHGPTGTARLFECLQEINPQPRWQHAIDACLQALRDSQLPARLHPGYWDNVARCCGTAGVGQLLVDRYQATGDLDVLNWVDSLAADVVARAQSGPHGVSWCNTEHTRTPPELPPEPGFMQGAAGIGGWLARLGAVTPEVVTAPSRPLREPRWL